MSQVDPNARSGGCPFLVKSHNGDKPYYAIPALFPNTPQQQQEERPIVLFDPSSHRSNQIIKFLIKYDAAQKLRFATFQSQVGQLLLRRMMMSSSTKVQNDEKLVSPNNDDESSTSPMMLCTSDKTYIQSSALLQIVAYVSTTASTTSKRIKLVQYLALASYILPTRLRDKLYNRIVSSSPKRRQRRRRPSSSSSANTSVYHETQYQDRFVNDGILTGMFHTPSSSSSSDAATTTANTTATVNLFQGENPPQRGDTVRIIWPTSTSSSSSQTTQQQQPQPLEVEPSITYDEEFPNGLCLIGGLGTITNVDLPLRVVVRIDRKSLGLLKAVEEEEEGKENGITFGDDDGTTMIAWVKPSEIALV